LEASPGAKITTWVWWSVDGDENAFILFAFQYRDFDRNLFLSSLDNNTKPVIPE